MPCEMCGREAPLRRATIEGTAMMVCPDCARFGIEHVGPGGEPTGRSGVVESLERRAARARERDVYQEMGTDLVPDFGARIRKARTERGLSVEDLGKRINEKASFLARIESGATRPSDELIRKLERELAIRLRGKEEEEPAAKPVSKPAAGALTLGDLLRRKREEP